MSDTRVSAAVGQTINTGNFESVRIDFSVEGSVKEGETPSQALDKAYALVEKKLLEKSQAVRDALGGK